MRSAAGSSFGGSSAELGSTATSSVAAQLDLAALRLTSPPASPAQQQPEGPVPQCSAAAFLAAPALVPRGEASPPASQPPSSQSESEGSAPRDQQHSDVTPLPLRPRHSLGSEASPLLSPLPELSPMQISPFPPNCPSKSRQQHPSQPVQQGAEQPDLSQALEACETGMAREQQQQRAEAHEPAEAGPQPAVGLHPTSAALNDPNQRAMCSPAAAAAQTAQVDASSGEHLGSTGSQQQPQQEVAAAPHWPPWDRHVPLSDAPKFGWGTLLRRQQQQVEQRQLAPGTSERPAVPPASQLPLPSHPRQLQPELQQPAPPQAQPAQQQQHAPPAGAGWQELVRRRAEEDQTVDSTCPPLLRDVLRHFPTQKEAFAFADRCNSSQPVLQQPAVLVSRLAAQVEQAERGPTSSSGDSGASSGSGAELAAKRACLGEAEHLALEGGAGGSASLPAPRLAQGPAAGTLAAQEPGSARPDFLSHWSDAVAAVGPDDYRASYARAQQAPAEDSAKLAAREMFLDALKQFRAPAPAGAPAAAHCAAADCSTPAGHEQPSHCAAAQSLLEQQGTGPGAGGPLPPAGELPTGSGAAGLLGSAGGGSAAGPPEGPREALASGAAPPVGVEPAQLHEEPIRVFCLEKQGRWEPGSMRRHACEHLHVREAAQAFRWTSSTPVVACAHDNPSPFLLQERGVLPPVCGGLLAGSVA